MARPILTGLLQSLKDFILGHLMVINMMYAGRRVDIDSGVQASSTLILALNCRPMLALLGEERRIPANRHPTQP